MARFIRMKFGTKNVCHKNCLACLAGFILGGLGIVE